MLAEGTTMRARVDFGVNYCCEMDRIYDIKMRPALWRWSTLGALAFTVKQSKKSGRRVLRGSIFDETTNNDPRGVSK